MLSGWLARAQLLGELCHPPEQHGTAALTALQGNPCRQGKGAGEPICGVSRGREGWQGTGYLLGSHVTREEARSPQAHGVTLQDPRAAFPTPQALEMPPPALDAAPQLTRRHPELSTSSGECRGMMEMASLGKPPPQRLGCPRALCFPPSVQDPQGTDLQQSAQQSGPAPTPPQAAEDATLEAFGSSWHCCEATGSTTAWGACGEPGSAPSGLSG